MLPWLVVQRVVLLLSWLSALSYGANIYGFPAMNFVSHSRVLWKVGRELSNRGHNYVHVLPDISTDTDLPGVQVATYRTSIPAERVERFMENMAHKGLDFMEFFFELPVLTNTFAEDVINSVELMEKLNSSADAILCDGPSNPTCLIVADMLKLPRIDLLPMGFSEPCVHVFYGQPQVFVHSVDPLSSTITPGTTFLARLISVFRTLAFWFILHPSITSTVWHKYAQNTSNFKNFQQVRGAANVVLVQSDFALTFPRPVHAHVKAIGPVLPEDAKELPDDLKQLTQEPFMIVSLGSVLSASNLKFTEMLANALARVNGLRVIWKHKGTKPEHVGKNTHILSWFPQNDLLGHPNAKLFLTHVGFNSLSEALYHGVPMVALPLFGDQFNNAGVIIEKSLGVVLNKDDLTEESLIKAIEETLGDSKYKENALIVSRIMRDRVSTPAEEAAYWVEYVLRHNGAAHLRSSALGMPWYQDCMLDVFAVIFFSCSILLVLLFRFFLFAGRIVYRMLRKCFTRGSRTVLPSGDSKSSEDKKKQ